MLSVEFFLERTNLKSQCWEHSSDIIILIRNLSIKIVLMRPSNKAMFYSQSELQSRTKIRKCHASDLLCNSGFASLT